MIDSERITEFGGIAGTLLVRTLSWRALVTGLFLGLVFVVLSVVFTLAGAPAIGSLALQALIALALARFALNGIHGEWRGTVFSGRGGTWNVVGAVAGRYLALTAVWLLPLFFLGLKDSPVFAPQPNMGGAGMGMSPMAAMGAVSTGLAIVSVYMIVSTITPPLFLIVAVSAQGFGDVFSPDHWRAQFSGRSSDLLMIYAVYAGALGMAVLVGFPILLGAFSIAWPLAVLVGGVGMAFVGGLAVDLLGRLCGFFAFGETRLLTGDESRPVAPVVGPDHGHDPGLDAGADPSPASVPVSGMPDESGLPIFRDAQPFLDDAWKRFKHDPDGAIEEVREAIEDHAPHALLAHGLTHMLHRAGQEEEAVESARMAMDVCFGGGQVYLAADLFRTLWPQRTRLNLDRDRMLKIAGVLAKKDDLTYAANTFAIVVLQDPKELRAVKGVLQIADNLLHKRHKPDEALRLYGYLLEHCPDSPLEEFMRAGRDEAQQKLARSQAS